MGKSSRASVWDEVRLRAASNAAGIAIWSWDPGSGAVGLDQEGRTLWGLPMKGPLTFETLFARVHPEDADRVRAAAKKLQVTPGPYDFDFRILHGSGTRWLSA
ncbi:MAG: PAS domain-containing protein, partial [Acetobacteraceae bacterium]|nr:PAS domain-containing protein [Acetobacteraceae bacterium]